MNWGDPDVGEFKLNESRFCCSLLSLFKSTGPSWLPVGAVLVHENLGITDGGNDGLTDLLKKTVF